MKINKYYKMQPKELEIYDELLEIEDEIWKHVCALDTQLLRKVIEYDYDSRLWLWISDQALNREMVMIKKDLILKDKYFIEHIQRYYGYEF